MILATLCIFFLPKVSIRSLYYFNTFLSINQCNIKRTKSTVAHTRRLLLWCQYNSTLWCHVIHYIKKWQLNFLCNFKIACFFALVLAGGHFNFWFKNCNFDFIYSILTQEERFLWRINFKILEKKTQFFPPIIWSHLTWSEIARYR